MSIESGFFNSLNGDRKYNAEKISEFFEGLISDGVFESVGNRLQVTAGDGMSVNIDTGRAFVSSHYIKNTAIYNLPLEQSDVQFPRIANIVVCCDKSINVRDVYFKAVYGDLAATPAPPALTRNENIWELCLAQVLIPAKSASVSQGNITDTRANTALCGYVTGLVKQVDTTQLFLQWQTAYEEYYAFATAEFNAYMEAKKKAFDEWFASLTETLKVDTTIRSYRSEFITTENTDSFPVGIDEYEQGDTVLVNINGIMLNEGTEYTVSGTGTTATINLANGVSADNVFGITCIKAVIGSNEVITYYN